MNIKRINLLQWLMDKIDRDILLAHVLGVSRTHLHTWPEQTLSSEQQKQFDALVRRREQGEPIAYLIGSQEFWSLSFEVNEHTLVPRPETELLVELVLKLSVTLFGKGEVRGIYSNAFTVADLGTGSGAIAIAIAHECPQWQILATDRAPETLAVAKRNAAHIGVSNVTFYTGDWCHALPVGTQCDLIVSNPPYIAEKDPHLQGAGVRYEPHSALVSGADGLEDISEIILQATAYLKPEGWLLLEHGYDQGERVRALLQGAAYTQVQTYPDLAGQDRVSVGQYSP